MATHIEFTNYRTGERKFKKLNAKARGESITYKAEETGFVIRSYYTGKVLQRMVAPFCSYSFRAVDKED